jgi:hypothetical protein
MNSGVDQSSWGPYLILVPPALERGSGSVATNDDYSNATTARSGIRYTPATADI